MRFVLTIESENAALADGHPNELGWLVEKVGRTIRSGVMPGTVLDGNGNTVGHIEFTPPDGE